MNVGQPKEFYFTKSYLYLLIYKSIRRLLDKHNLLCHSVKACSVCADSRRLNLSVTVSLLPPLPRLLLAVPPLCLHPTHKKEGNKLHRHLHTASQLPMTRTLSQAHWAPLKGSHFETDTPLGSGAKPKCVFTCAFAGISQQKPRSASLHLLCTLLLLVLAKREDSEEPFLSTSLPIPTSIFEVSARHAPSTHLPLPTCM